jgi:hypothetical protein
MANVTVDREGITVEETMAALRQELGEGHKLTEVPPDGIRVQTNAMMVAKVQIRRQPGATVFHISGYGFIIGRIITELVIVRRVEAALKRAPLGTAA